MKTSQIMITILMSLLWVAAAAAMDVKLQWDPNTESNLAGYKVYYGIDGLASPSYLDVKNQTVATISGLDPAHNYSFAVVAYSTSGLESSLSNIVKAPELIPPVVSISNPTSNAKVSNTVLVTATAADNVGVVKVEYYVDNILMSTDTSIPYQYSWDTHQIAAGTHNITAKAYDAAGNVGNSSAVVTIVRKNTVKDFDGDGKTDMAVWDPTKYNWFIRNSATNTQSDVYYGIAGDITVSGDYDGDGKTDIAVWRPSDGNWYINNSSTGSQSVTNYGTSGDIPIPGDYDGDGKTDIAVWRPSTGNWYIINSATNTQSVVTYGTSGDIPVPGDYDGDGKIDNAVWRKGTWYITNSATNTQSVTNYGTSGDLPVPGDYDGDGITDKAVWRKGTWYITNSATNMQNVVNFGTTGDTPVPGDYDGIGRTETAVWRPAEGNWYILNSVSGTQRVSQLGIPTDQPVK